MVPNQGSQRMTSKGRNYLPAEQETLCRAWLQVSLDLILGNDQKSSNFYDKVAEIFNQEHEARSACSLQINWRDTIQKQVSLFCGAYKKAVHNPPSGTNGIDHMRTALELYKLRSKKSAFRLHHCWLILKDAPKWSVAMEP
ncbi:hypothetical protein H257_07550 [Aphanomyces astaci]|uniref:No apical meristem-associated C-terminal domain-containing protein n=1 Tax=Aphanomyces astaci TaxID=112090 RepID=W4GHD3_APHAT|nr:hypothetical protein H257_07550 [Aphanomyces astaci]ETV78696.1 hypothetical protein H257_07550 [Aphanomyces astaci]|eukprot:XP_009831415.1 hypothetical protein H257_07550 [Aphanomyces astaci]